MKTKKFKAQIEEMHAQKIFCRAKHVSTTTSAPSVALTSTADTVPTNPLVISTSASPASVATAAEVPTPVTAGSTNSVPMTTAFPLTSPKTPGKSLPTVTVCDVYPSDHSTSSSQPKSQ